MLIKSYYDKYNQKWMGYKLCFNLLVGLNPHFKSVQATLSE